MLAAWFAGALVGALRRQADRAQRLVAWTVAGLIALYVLLNVFVLPLSGLDAGAVRSPRR